MCTSSNNEEHDSFVLFQRGTNIIHHRELFGCQWGTPERKDTRGKIFLCKLPYTTNNGCYANHVQHVSKMWGRFQSNMSRVSNSTEKTEMFMHRNTFILYLVHSALCIPFTKENVCSITFFPLSDAWSCPVTWWLRESNLEQTSNLTMFYHIPEMTVPMQDDIVHAKSKKYVTPICILIVMFTHPFSGSRVILNFFVNSIVGTELHTEDAWYNHWPATPRNFTSTLLGAGLCTLYDLSFKLTTAEKFLNIFFTLNLDVDKPVSEKNLISPLLVPILSTSVHCWHWRKRFQTQSGVFLT